MSSAPITPGMDTHSPSKWGTMDLNSPASFSDFITKHKITTAMQITIYFPLLRNLTGFSIVKIS